MEVNLLEDSAYFSSVLKTLDNFRKLLFRKIVLC